MYAKFALPEVAKEVFFADKLPTGAGVAVSFEKSILVTFDVAAFVPPITYP